MRAIFDEYGHFQLRVEFFEYLACYFNACENTFFFDYKMLPALFFCWDGAECGVIAVTNIFSKGKIEKIVDKFVLMENK